MLLHAANIIAGYGGEPILHGVDIELNSGQIGVIVGTNGAGKSTVLKCLFGLIKLEQGTVKLEGNDITDVPPDKRVANFAHADLMTVGAYLALVLSAVFSGGREIAGLPAGFMVLPLAAAGVAILAIGLDRLFYRPLRERNVKPILLLVASIGVTLMLVGFSETLAIFNWSILLRPLQDYMPQWIDIPARLAFVPTEYKIVVPFVILIAVLIWRPTGIFRGQVL